MCGRSEHRGNDNGVACIGRHRAPCARDARADRPRRHHARRRDRTPVWAGRRVQSLPGREGRDVGAHRRRRPRAESAHTDVNQFACHAAADYTKTSPCGPVVRPSYISALKRAVFAYPLRGRQRATHQTAAQFNAAGAEATGVGPEIPTMVIEHRNDRWIRELAHRFLYSVRDARGQRAIMTRLTIHPEIARSALIVLHGDGRCPHLPKGSA